MVNINKLRATFFLIRCSLSPANKGDICFDPPENGSRTNITPAEFSAALADITSLLRPDGTLELHFADALFPAAPFLLSRLKSWGFSGCRVVVTPHGLLLTGKR